MSTQDKLAEALRDAEATVLAFLGDVAFDGSVCGIKQATVKGMFARLQAHAAEAAQPQAAESHKGLLIGTTPSGVPYSLHGTKESVTAVSDMLEQAEVSRQLGADQPQSAEPVAYRAEWNGDVSDEGAYVYCQPNERDSEHQWEPLYTHPQPAQDARDVARLDWLEAHPRLASIVIDGHATDCYLYGISGAMGLKLREILDAAMAKESGNE